MLERAKEVTRDSGWARVESARHADDLVILVDGYRRHAWLLKAVDRWLREELAKLDLRRNEAKSRIVDLGQGEAFGFLGFDFRRVRSLRGAGGNEADRSNVKVVEETFSTAGGSFECTFQPHSMTAIELQATPGTGLKSEYFENTNFTLPRLTRIDPTIDFDWKTGSPDPAVGAFSARWTGHIRVVTREPTRFTRNRTMVFAFGSR